jgi:hypothetical protein
MAAVATLIMWFHLRSPVLAEDFERLMARRRVQALEAAGGGVGHTRVLRATSDSGQGPLPDLAGCGSGSGGRDSSLNGKVIVGDL